MPAIVSGAVSGSQIFYSSYLSTYIERDVRDLSEAIDALKFLRFMTATAARCGQMLNILEIAQGRGYQSNPGEGLAGYSGDAGNHFLSAPLFHNLLKRLVKTPKLYFYDTGLVCYLTKWSSAETLESGAMNARYWKIMWCPRSQRHISIAVWNHSVLLPGKVRRKLILFWSMTGY